MKIEKYCKLYCNNVQAEFARKFGRLSQNVTVIFNHTDKWRVMTDEKPHLLVPSLTLRA